MKKIAAALIITALAVSMVGCSSNNNNQTTAKYTEGTYTAYSDATDKGYGWVEVTIKDDKITEVKLGETNGFGDEKPEDYRHEAFHQAKAELPAKFVAANSSTVEALTGATSSSGKWMQAVERALDTALVKNDNKLVYFNGTFLGSSDQTDKGRGVVLVTVENDKITNVEVMATTFTKDETPKEVFKNESYPYESFHGAVVEMPGRFIEANKATVDIFTGATSSSNQWIQGVERALEKAKR